MNWFTLAGALLHLLNNLPQTVDSVERLFDDARGQHKAPLDAWQAVTDKIAEVRRTP